MILDRNSVHAGYCAAMRRMSAELLALKAETVREFATLMGELEQARDELHATKMAFLRFKQMVTKDKALLAEIARDRAIIQGQVAERDPTQLLQ